MGTPVRELAELTGRLTGGSADRVTTGEVVVGTATLDRRQQHLPVGDPLSSLLPEGGLVRGRAVSCTGGAAVTVALGLVAAATQQGSWLAIVGLPWLGVDAAREAGVALERTVRVDLSGDLPGEWAERVAAAADGFELVLTRVPRRLPDRVLRQVRQRFQARGAVLLDVDPWDRAAPASGAEVAIDAVVHSWIGLDHGNGHLRDRVVEVTVRARRSPRPRRLRWVPRPTTTVSAPDR